jgi:hypothetical protein
MYSVVLAPFLAPFASLSANMIWRNSPGVTSLTNASGSDAKARPEQVPRSPCPDPAEAYLGRLRGDRGSDACLTAPAGKGVSRRHLFGVRHTRARASKTKLIRGRPSDRLRVLSDSG